MSTRGRREPWSSSEESAPTVLVVDDEPSVQELLRDALKMRGLDSEVASSLTEARRRLKLTRYDIAVVDVSLPDGSGLAMIEESAAQGPLVIVITGGNGIETAIRAMRGGAIDFIQKPFAVGDFLKRLDVAVEHWRLRESLFGSARALETLVRMRTEEVSRTSRELDRVRDLTVEALGGALNLKDHETADHCRRVAENSVALGKELALSDFELRSLRWGAYLHDIGKIGIPDSILLKNGPLSREERTIMERHPIMGHSLIRNVGFLRYASDVILYHHEAYDGSGYPHALRGIEIPLDARIFRIFDTLDAMTSDRPYREAVPFSRARQEIEQYSGKMFDPEVVEAFMTLPESTWLVQNGSAA